MPPCSVTAPSLRNFRQTALLFPGSLPPIPAKSLSFSGPQASPSPKNRLTSILIAGRAWGAEPGKGEGHGLKVPRTWGAAEFISLLSCICGTILPVPPGPWGPPSWLCMASESSASWKREGFDRGYPSGKRGALSAGGPLMWERRGRGSRGRAELPAAPQGHLLLFLPPPAPA